MQRFGGFGRVRVSADGRGVVSHAGVGLLREMAEKIGLVQAVSGALIDTYRTAVDAVIAQAVSGLADVTSTARACALLGRPRASHYRAQQPPAAPAQRPPRASPPNALSVAEQDQVITVLTNSRFCDKSVAQTWATLLDEGVNLASMSTMHRLLRLSGRAGDRRDQASYPTRARPELMATAPGQVWSWDITKLCAPDRGIYYDVYVSWTSTAATSSAGPSPPARAPRSLRT